MKKMLITGVSGFVGSNLAVYFRDKYRVTGTYYKTPIRIKGCQTLQVDICNKNEVSGVISRVQPNIIVHCAAMTDIDECERKPELASRVNLVAVESLCRMVGPTGVQLVFFSTDQVYDSPRSQTQSCHEFSLLKPITMYARTKGKAEEMVKEFCVNYQVVRLALCYGMSAGVNRCFTDGLDVGLRRRKPFTLFTNQFRTPILVDDVCVCLDKIIEDSPPNETYNIGGPQIISRAVFGKLYAKIFNYDEKTIVPVTMTASADHAPRPFNASLDTGKFIQRFRYTPLAPEAGIKKLYLQKRMIF